MKNYWVRHLKILRNKEKKLLLKSILRKVWRENYHIFIKLARRVQIWKRKFFKIVKSLVTDLLKIILVTWIYLLFTKIKNCNDSLHHVYFNDCYMFFKNKCNWKIEFLKFRLLRIHFWWKFISTTILMQSL